MQLQTQLNLKPQDEQLQISYTSKIVLLGSCFAENIAEKFNYFQFQNFSNPIGVLFHPKAIESFIKRVVSGVVYTDEDVFFYNEQWHCFEVHSVLSHPEKAVLLEQLNDARVKTAEQLVSATHISITLGTAWVYKHIETDKIVANCHKVPQKAFNKKLLTVNEIAESLQSIQRLIKAVNNRACFIFTLSPVRHLKDGFVENQISKAHLISAIYSVISPHDNLGGYYFESYEIVLDELRDYRFYKDDMLHPNALAVAYVWEKFVTVWVTKEAQSTMLKVDSIRKSMTHRPFNAQSDAYQKFRSNLMVKIEKLKIEYPHFSF